MFSGITVLILQLKTDIHAQKADSSDLVYIYICMTWQYGRPVTWLNLNIFHCISKNCVSNKDVALCEVPYGSVFDRLFYDIR